MSNILKGLNEGRNYGRDSWDSNMPGYQGDYGGAKNFGRRNREWDEDDRIDARIRAEYEKKQEYERNGTFWLKLKDSQRHLPSGPFKGKQAANTAAIELLNQQPELKGNLVITAYGPDEQVNELSNNTLASYKKKAGADASAADKKGDYKRGDKRMSGIIKATKKEFDNDSKNVSEDELDENCWKGYHKEGNKELFGKTVPNCVKNEGVAEGPEFDKWANDRAASQLYKLKPATLWEVSFDYGPHQSDSVKVKARSAQEAVDKVETAAEKKGRSIMVNWARPAEQGVGEGIMNKITNKVMGAAPEQPQYKVGQRVKYETSPHQPDWADGGSGVGVITDYKNGHYMINGNPVNHFEIKGVVEQGVAEEQHSCPHCGGEMVSEELMNEKKDACYYKVKSRYKVWPSAYASGALVKCRKKGADSWGNGGKKNESSILEGIEQVDENLHKWFKEKWVRFGPDGKIRGDCARGDDSEGKPKCLPQSKAQNLGKKGRASAAARKRREDPNPERSGKAINVNTKKKANEEALDEKWSQKYKDSINCSNPKGFSQKAHCQGKNK